jgi:hypothetical protein
MSKKATSSTRLFVWTTIGTALAGYVAAVNLVPGHNTYPVACGWMTLCALVAAFNVPDHWLSERPSESLALLACIVLGLPLLIGIGSMGYLIHWWITGPKTAEELGTYYAHYPRCNDFLRWAMSESYVGWSIALFVFTIPPCFTSAFMKRP